MEESIRKCNFPDLYGILHERFDMKEVDVRTYSGLALAYIGDAIYDLVIRSLVMGKGNTNVNDLHHQTSKMVKASAQSEMMDAILPELSDEEEAVYRRGRNAKSQTVAKNATVADYRKATGFEALMGYLYLTGQTGRMLDLIELGLTHLDAAVHSLKLERN